MRKGINEIIGAILLIAVVVLIIGIVAGWNLKWVGTETEAQACLSKTNFIIESTKLNFSGNDMYQVKITNFGSLSLYGFGVTMSSDTDLMEFKAGDVTQGGVSESSPLKRGQSAYLMVDMKNLTSFANSVSEIVVTNKACSMVSTRAVVGP